MGSWWDVFRSIIYGLVEGITEWLPISSTGHLILLEEWLPLDQSAEFFSMYLVVIQLGAIMAVSLHIGTVQAFCPSDNCNRFEGDLTQGARDSFGQDSTALRREEHSIRISLPCG